MGPRQAADTVTHETMHIRSRRRPADNLGLVKNALNANPKPEIDFVIVRNQRTRFSC